jgi:hypothetical protein
MGEVYEDPDRVARFEREARVPVNGPLRVLVAATLAWAAAAPAAPASQVATGGAPPAPCRAVVSARFELRSHPLLNLHHFLYQWARAASPPDGDHRRPVAVPERDHLGDLSPAEREAWEAALSHYAEHLVPRDLLFTHELVELKARLAALPCAGEDVALAGDLGPLLARALPVYRARWWPGHDAANRAWIAEQSALLAAHEQALARRLAEAYGGAWPPERIRVDVVRYANWAGAYTTNSPDHVTISASPHTGLPGLELLLHEVSHVAAFEQRLLGAVAAAFRRQGGAPPDRLAHAIQFVTPAELIRSLDGEAAAGVTFVADEMARRPRNRERYRVVRHHWGRFLAGETERSEALDGIAAELAR